MRTKFLLLIFFLVGFHISSKAALFSLTGSDSAFFISSESIVAYTNNSIENVSTEDLKAFDAKDQKDKQGKAIALAQAAAGTDVNDLLEKLTEALASMDGSRMDVNADTRSIVGDNYNDITERCGNFIIWFPT